MDDLNPGEMATTIIHLAHVRRRLEALVAQLEQRNVALEAEIERLRVAAADEQLHSDDQGVVPSP